MDLEMTKFFFRTSHSESVSERKGTCAILSSVCVQVWQVQSGLKPTANMHKCDTNKTHRRHSAGAALHTHSADSYVELS